MCSPKILMITKKEYNQCKFISTRTFYYHRGDIHQETEPSKNEKKSSPSLVTATSTTFGPSSLKQNK